MSKPVCPKCDSTNVVSSLAKCSHNNCVGCGYSGFVREFHEPEFRTVKARNPIIHDTDAMPGEPKIGEPGAPLTNLVKRSKPFDKAEVRVEGNPSERKPYWWEKD